MSEHRTGESASGAWPTATAQGSEGTGCSAASGARHTGTTLTDAAVRQWPTASAQSYGYNQGGSAGRVGPMRPSLDALARGRNTPRASMAAKGGNPDRKQPRGDLEAQARGAGLPARQTCTHGGTCKPTLNPAFVEWLMGFPIGWTGFAPSATAWSLWLRRARSEFLRLGSPSEWRP